MKTAWQEVAREYAMYLDAPDAERIRKEHTIVTPGARILRLAKNLETNQ
jgi:hypothetical protein